MLVHDPVFDEGKKEEKKGKDVKKGDKQVVEEEKKEEEEQDYTNLMKGDRQVSYIPLHFNTNQLFKTAKQVIPTPVYPDPSNSRILIITQTLYLCLSQFSNKSCIKPREVRPKGMGN